MTKIDQLIDKFKEFKEELNKAICPYTHKDAKLCPKDCPCKKDLKKNVNMSYSAAPNTVTGTSGGQGGMYRSEHLDKQMISASPGGAQDAMAMAEGGETKHDRCAKEVKEKNPSVRNPHAVCVAAGVEPDKWKKSAAEKFTLHKNGQWALDDGTNREANPKLRSKDVGPGGKIHMVKDEDPEVHNKGKFKVMEMAPEKESKKEDVKGKPYSGKDKDVHKGEHQGNEAKGFDENKAPGRGTLSN